MAVFSLHQYATNITAFKDFCHETSRIYVSLYPWYPMPTSWHVALMHGYQIMETVPFPIGMLSEEAQECRNKDLKMFRDDLTMKNNRLIFY